MGDTLRRILTAAAMAAAFASIAGCGLQGPPPVSDKVAQYYSNPPKPTVAPEVPLKVVPLATIRKIVEGAGPLTISVLGDSTGNDADEWVELWAQSLAADATVSVRHWKEGATVWPVTSYGSGDRPIAIWNGSQPGSNGAYARERFQFMQPVRPDLIIYNFGHNASPNGTSADIEALQRMAEARWGKPPFVVTLQNAARGSYKAVTDKSISDLKAWATPRKVPLLDVQSVIPAESLDGLLVDDVHPNKQASRLWADKVEEVLG